RAPVAADVAVERTRLHVGYLWESEDTPRWSNVRLATYVVSTMPVPTVPNVLSISTTEIAFGEIKVGTDSVFVPVTLTNHGAVPFGPLMGFGGAPATAEFSSYQSCEGETLGPRGGSCNFYFKFSPSGPGEFNDVSNVVYSETSYAEGQRFTVALTGIGVP